MYQNAHYEQVWIANLKNYLDDAKYFNIYLYFKSIITLQKEMQYLAKGLLKLYKKESKTAIETFLKKYKSKYSYSDVFEKYKYLGIDKIDMKLGDECIDENNIAKFLEEIYANS